MQAIKSALGWLGRKAIVFAALVGALLIYQATKPSFEGFRKLRQNADELAVGQRELADFTAIAIRNTDARLAALQRMTSAQMDARLAAAKRERTALMGACGSDLAALLVNGTAGVIYNRRQCLRATLLTREIDTLAAIEGSLDARLPGEALPQALRRSAGVMHRSAAVYRDAGASLNRLHRDYVPDLFQKREIDEQRARLAKAKDEAAAAQRDARMLVATQRSIAAATRRASEAIDDARRQYRALVEERGGALRRDVIHKAAAWADANDLPGVIRAAALALLLIIATPFLIRLFCYFILAPAATRGAIRLSVPGSTNAAIAPAEPSTTSVGVRLAEHEELLVRQDYLQTSSHVGAKSTQWFLDWRHPVMSVATGLTFLTRIRGGGEVTTVSAVRDAFAEVAILTLPEGSACVLQPRALAAVAQPIGRPLRVTTHWRLGALNAWLTMQLRYVVFHGPVRLVIKGGRGVRIERAERGRVFGQEQLVGFSTDLAYSVSRAETFWPYFLGREQLLKDRVEAGAGILIVEESPLAGRRSGEVRRGIEGMIDAGLKVFGL